MTSGSWFEMGDVLQHIAVPPADHIRAHQTLAGDPALRRTTMKHTVARRFRRLYQPLAVEVWQVGCGVFDDFHPYPGRREGVVYDFWI